MNIDVMVKIARGSKNLYEKGKDGLRLVKTLARQAPSDYGQVLRAHSVGGMGCIVLSEEPAVPGSVVSAKAIGAVEIKFDNAMDHEIIAVPADSEIRDIKQIQKQKREEILSFIEELKKIELGKNVKIISMEDAAQADRTLKKAMELYKRMGE